MSAPRFTPEADAELTAKFDASCRAIAAGIDRRDGTIAELCEALEAALRELPATCSAYQDGLITLAKARGDQ